MSYNLHNQESVSILEREKQKRAVAIDSIILVTNLSVQLFVVPLMRLIHDGISKSCLIG